tara:strand:- start:215 stop:556 length:342 start_codon:yes stop_codon:yes gene_type:complete
MAHLTFYWDTWAIFEDNDIFRMLQREDYEGKTWEECCEKCARCWNWDDSDLVKGYEEKIIETDRQLKEISIHENGEEIEAAPEIYEYYQNAVEKFEKTKVTSLEKPVIKKLIN